MQTTSCWNCKHASIHTYFRRGVGASAHVGTFKQTGAFCTHPDCAPPGPLIFYGKTRPHYCPLKPQRAKKATLGLCPHNGGKSKFNSIAVSVAQRQSDVFIRQRLLVQIQPETPKQKERTAIAVLFFYMAFYTTNPALQRICGILSASGNSTYSRPYSS